MAYREYFFEREPFLPALDVKMRGRDREWGQIEAFLEESFQGNRTRAFLILADYGYGKTFILNKIREGVSDPDSKIKGANKTITASLVLAETEPSSSISYEYVTNIMFSVGRKRIEQIAKKLPKNSMGDFSNNFRIVMEAARKKKDEAFKWLIGETLTAKERAEIGVMRKFHPKESLRVLLDFMKAMKKTGNENLLVLLDEFEYAVNVYSESKLTQFFHTFKNIYDRFVSEGGSQVFAKHIQIIATTPRGWDVVTDLEAKLRRTSGGGGITPWLERMRFERNKVTLGPLSKKDANQIILDRIERERMKFAHLEYKTFPFIHPSFFDEILSSSKGNPRNILDFSEIILEEAARRNLREIDGNIARRILAEFKLVKEE